MFLQTKQKPKPILSRIPKLIILALLIASFFLYRQLYSLPPQTCLNDALHNFTAPLNASLKNGNDNLVIGIGQVIMDGWIITIFIFWLIKIKNLRYPVSTALVFLIRSVIMQIELFPFPQNLVWHSPGFPSLTVPYDHTRDFFFSGHTTTLALITLEFIEVRLPFPALTATASLLYIINMLLITRVHYTVDIEGAFIFSLFFHRLSSRYVYYLDWVFSLPIWIYRFLRKKKSQLDDQKKYEKLSSTISK